MEEMQKTKIFKNAENDRQKVAATHPTKVCKIPCFFLNLPLCELFISCATRYLE